MFLRKSLFMGSILLLLTSLNVHALTKEDCRKRVEISIDNAAKLGGTDADKLRWAQIAADDCYKEAAAQGGSSSSSSGGGIGAIILLLAAAGFVAYKIIAKRDQPLTASQISRLREEVREIFKVEISDSESMREFKEKRLADAEDMFSLALKGELPITQNSMSGAIVEARKEIYDLRESRSQAKAAAEVALAASIRVRDSANAIFAMPMEDENDSEELEAREIIKKALAKAEMDIKKYREEIASL